MLFGDSRAYKLVLEKIFVGSEGVLVDVYYTGRRPDHCWIGLSGSSYVVFSRRFPRHKESVPPKSVEP